jgi:tetratricopeptide (TPR) repeat protein
MPGALRAQDPSFGRFEQSRIEADDAGPRLPAQSKVSDLWVTNTALPMMGWICAMLVALQLAPTTAEAAPRDAKAEAAIYERCAKLARQDPTAAEKLAQSWHERGGAHPADHCAALALIGLQQYKEAAARLEALAQAMTTAPAALRAEVLDQAGQAWGLAGDPVRAYAAAGAAVALQPNDPELLIDRAEAAASAGFFDKAIGDLDHVLKASPNRVDALIYRASAYRALDRLDPALADIERALALEPKSAPALLERGNIRRLRGDSDGARRDWERVGQLARGSQADMAAKANVERLERSTSPEPAKSQNGQ